RQLGVAGTSVVQVGVRVLIGMVLGAMIALYDELPLPKMGPLAQELIGSTPSRKMAVNTVLSSEIFTCANTTWRNAVARRLVRPI
ncbi:hypothetical protein, partial [Enterobacter hormaechei]|uniref:hypothetical protein n=1 Tax=Enterobacter hormaechei TaxID=158836 RepID=UPI00203D25B5